MARCGATPSGSDRTGPQVYDFAYDPAKGHLYFADVYGELFVIDTKGAK